MKTFQQFFSDGEILRQICKVRVKISKNRSKKHLLHLLTENEKYNYHQEKREPRNEFDNYQVELNDLLSTILPPRKKWVKLGFNSRKKKGSSSEFLSSNDKNLYALLKTIKLHQKRKSTDQWFLNLMKFVSEIKELANSQTFIIEDPIVFPKLKDEVNNKRSNECRPICIFGLKDRVILSITNKFLTQLFDRHFLDSSFAFRAKRNHDNMILSHHDCLRGILSYLHENKERELYVVECDMQKFYDTVNHTIVKAKFNEFIGNAIVDNPTIDLSAPIRIFNSYLNSFAFNINVPKKNDYDYWKSYGLEDGEFTWVHGSLSEYYDDLSNERIGVPQGGALSGLIANIYLTYADKEMQKAKVLYQRFCDDMIVISDDLTECERAKKLYEDALRHLKLFPHKFKVESELKTSTSEGFNFRAFWDGKSKGPYRWGKIESNCFPWIGFVGYEVNREGDIRIRKKSFEKELKKQKLIIKEIKNAIEVSMRKSKGTATELAINRLIGMSVGRIGLDNFDEVSTDLCWKNGFKELAMNKHSIRQIKHFDRNRSKHYYKLLKEIKNPDVELEKKENERQLIKYNKPFSYYYQILERQQNN